LKESDAVGRLLKKLAEVMPGGVGFKHFDLVTAGVPDLSWTWAKRTLWIEVKLDTVEARPIQEVIMTRLGARGIALYVAFFTFGQYLEQGKLGPHTLILDSWKRVLVRYDGLDYLAVAKFVRKVIEGNHA
jgi:hypothetical protein